jgi:hypothetical protein
MDDDMNLSHDFVKQFQLISPSTRDVVPVCFGKNLDKFTLGLFMINPLPALLGGSLLNSIVGMTSVITSS